MEGGVGGWCRERVVATREVRAAPGEILATTSCHKKLKQLRRGCSCHYTMAQVRVENGSRWELGSSLQVRMQRGNWHGRGLENLVLMLPSAANAVIAVLVVSDAVIKPSPRSWLNDTITPARVQVESASLRKRASFIICDRVQVESASLVSSDSGCKTIPIPLSPALALTARHFTSCVYATFHLKKFILKVYSVRVMMGTLIAPGNWPLLS